MLNRVKNWLGNFMMTKDDLQDFNRRLDLLERKMAAQSAQPGASKNKLSKTQIRRKPRN